MAILLFFCILFSILSIRMLIVELAVVFNQRELTNYSQWVAYIPTCILWSIFYYLS